MASFCEVEDKMKTTEFATVVDYMPPSNIFDDNYFLDSHGSDLFGDIDAHSILFTPSVATPGPEMSPLDGTQVMICDDEVHAANRINLQKSVSFQDINQTSFSVFDDGITADDLGSLLSQFEQVSETSRSQSPIESGESQESTVSGATMADEDMSISILPDFEDNGSVLIGNTAITDALLDSLNQNSNIPNGAYSITNVMDSTVTVSGSTYEVPVVQSNTITTSRSDSALLDSANIAVDNMASSHGSWDHDYCQAPPKMSHVQKMAPGVSASSIHADDRSSPFRIIKPKEEENKAPSQPGRNRYNGFKIKKGSPNVKINRVDSPCLELNSSDKAMLKALLLNDDALKQYNEKTKNANYKDVDTSVVPMDIDEDLDCSMSSLDVTEETVSTSGTPKEGAKQQKQCDTNPQNTKPQDPRHNWPSKQMPAFSPRVNNNEKHAPAQTNKVDLNQKMQVKELTGVPNKNDNQVNLTRESVRNLRNSRESTPVQGLNDNRLKFSKEAERNRRNSRESTPVKVLSNQEKVNVQVLNDNGVKLRRDLERNSRESTPVKVISNQEKVNTQALNANENEILNNKNKQMEVQPTKATSNREHLDNYNGKLQNYDADSLKKLESPRNANVNFEAKQAKHSHNFKKNFNSVDNSAFYDKLPPYVTALSKPAPPKQSSSLPILTNDSLPQRDPSPDKNEALFSKLPAYYSCFTNSTKYDSITASKMKDADNLKYNGCTDGLNNNNNNVSRDNSSSSIDAPVMRHSRSRTKRRCYRTGPSNTNDRNSSSSSSQSRSKSPSSRSYSPSSSISSIKISPSRSRSRSKSSEYQRPVFRISSSSRSRSRSSSSSSSASDGVRRSRSRYRSRSPIRSRSRSQSRSSRYRNRRRSRSPSLSPVRRRRNNNRYPSEEWKAKQKIKREQEKAMQIEQRRIVYVGRIAAGMNKVQLRKQFDMFGDIEEASVHFRENGDNYGFVTFMYTCDAYAAIEKGNTIRGNERYDLCFGGRRQFCKSDYADLDGNAEEEEEMAPVVARKKEAVDFDELLRQATKKIKKSK